MDASIIDFFKNNQIDIGSGIIAGLAAAVVFLAIQQFIGWFRNQVKFRPIAGDYDGYIYDDEEKRIINFDKPESKAKITYLRRQLLKIKVTTRPEAPEPDEWEGTISMSSEYEEIGDIAWRYTTFPENVRWFGFKRIIADRKAHELWVIGESPYGVEIFVRAGSKPKLAKGKRLEDIAKELYKS